MSLEALPEFCKRQIPRCGPSRVIFNRRVGPGWHLLRLEEESLARASQPGQFVQILCAEEGSSDPLLRRPFSVYDADPRAGTYDVLYITSGRGTRWMAALPEDGRSGGGPVFVDVIGPFGNQFEPPAVDAAALLVGGGVGVAPLYFFARKLCASARPPQTILLLMGARTAAQLQGIEDFRRLPIRTEVATNDGSEGFHGLVTGLLEHVLDREPDYRKDKARIRIYGCGPTAMNEALRALSAARGLACEICLEAYMACGFGICFACVVPIRKRLDGPIYNRRICLEGPVFDSRLIAPGTGMTGVMHS
jgi:dihydroorotate dehydrogenase electron transfer subunit